MAVVRLEAACAECQERRGAPASPTRYHSERRDPPAHLLSYFALKRRSRKGAPHGLVAELDETLSHPFASIDICEVGSEQNSSSNNEARVDRRRGARTPFVAI